MRWVLPDIAPVEELRNKDMRRAAGVSERTFDRDKRRGLVPQGRMDGYGWVYSIEDKELYLARRAARGLPRRQRSAEVLEAGRLKRNQEQGERVALVKAVRKLPPAAIDVIWRAIRASGFAE
jgi:hypothetical protein